VALSWSAKAIASASPISHKPLCCQPVACTSQAAAACPGRAALCSAWLRGAPARSRTPTRRAGRAVGQAGECVYVNEAGPDWP